MIRSIYKYLVDWRYKNKNVLFWATKAWCCSNVVHFVLQNRLQNVQTLIQFWEEEKVFLDNITPSHVLEEKAKTFALEKQIWTTNLKRVFFTL